MKPRNYITLAEAEKFSGIRADTLKKRCQVGMIPGAVKQGKTWLVPHQEIIKGAERKEAFAYIYALLAQQGLSISITVFVGGNIFSGMLVSYEEYLKETKTQLLEVADQNTSKVFKKIWNFLEGEKPNYAEGDINYIHLKTEEFDSIVRINIKSIDAIMLGQVN